MSAPVHYEWTCPECGTRIHLGDPIRHDEDHDDWVHASCSEAPHDDREPCPDVLAHHLRLRGRAMTHPKTTTHEVEHDCHLDGQPVRHTTVIEATPMRLTDGRTRWRGVRCDGTRIEWVEG